jgi:hypothetical protein
MTVMTLIIASLRLKATADRAKKAEPRWRINRWPIRATAVVYEQSLANFHRQCSDY